MKNLKSKLANVQIEKLEERKEFTFYICYDPCQVPSCKVPTCPEHGETPGNGGN